MESVAELKALWCICFGDEESFIDRYFAACYSPATNRCVVREGAIVAALQALPFPYELWGKQVAMRYISGVATHPKFRKQGIMRKLLGEVHREMYHHGVVLTTLVPADAHMTMYYGRCGYAAVFTYDEVLLGDEVVWQRPADKLNSPYGMARIICAEQALRCYAAAHPQMACHTLCVCDDDIAQNNGYYTLGEGVCSRVNPSHTAVTHCNMAQLTALIVGHSGAELRLNLIGGEVTL